MNILNRRITTHLRHQLTKTQTYSVYIHLQDHNTKITPKQNRLHLSYMDPKQIPETAVANPPFSAKLRKTAEEELKKRLFEQYKEKILAGIVDVEEEAVGDLLWGDRDVPVHYYRFLSGTQVGLVSHSILRDVQHLQQDIVKQYLETAIKTTSLAQAKQLNQYAEVAAYHRLTNTLTRQISSQIQTQISNKFHLLSPKSLILLKYAFNTSPKTITPEFNTILNHLLLESLSCLSVEDLVHLMYFNRADLYRIHRGNLQIPLLETLAGKFGELGLEGKVDFLCLFVESRGPTIRPESHNRYYNEIRNRTQEIIYHLNIDSDLSKLSETSILKLAYSLVRAKTNMTDHLTLSIVQYIEQNLQKISAHNQALFFIYLNKIEGGKSIENMELMKALKEKVVGSWEMFSSVDKLRALDAMFNLNLYDEAAHQLYTAIPIEADSSMLGYFCRLEMMTSSGREWEIVHRLVELDFIPLPHYQDCKRFYNYVSVTAPEWKLDPLRNKLVNSEIFFDSMRLESLSRDKKFYRGIREFQKFSNISVLPKHLKMGMPVRNVEFAQFCLPQYQISVDVITDVERVRGTQELKGSYLAKIKSLECVGWKQLYVFEKDIQKLPPNEFFDYIYSICEPHFESQLAIIAEYEKYRSYEVEQMMLAKNKAELKMRELEQYMVVQDFALVQDEHDIKNKDILEKEENLKQRESKSGQRVNMEAMGGTGGPGG